MRTWPSPARLLIPALALAGVVAVGAVYLRPTPPVPLEEFAPGVDPAFRRVLVGADDAEFLEHCRDMGEPLMTQHWFELFKQPVKGVPGSFEQLEPYLARFASAYGDIYDIRVGHYMLAALRRTPADTVAEADRRAAALDVVRRDASVPDSTVIALALADRAYCQRHGLSWLTILFDSRLVRLEAGRGRREAAWRHLDNGLADARRVGHMMQTCQLLGVAYQMHMEEGRADSAYHYLDLAEARARRSRSAFQTARILGFRAGEAMDEGRFGAAHLHLVEAWRTCEEFRGGGVTTRTLLNLADLYEDLDCWPAHEQILATIRTTVSLPPRFFDSTSLIRENLRIRKHDMRSAFAHGDSARGLALMDSVVEVFGPRPFTELYTRYQHDRAALLAELGRYEAATEVSDQVLAHAASDHLDDWQATLQVQRAAIALAQSDTAGARRALASWRLLEEAGAVPAESGTAARAAALEVRTTRGEEQIVALRTGLGAFQAAASRGDAGVSSYLQIAAFDELRWIIHELLADDPALGLDFEMRWRRVSRPGSRVPCPGCGSAAGCDCPAATPLDLLIHWSRPVGAEPFSAGLKRAGRTGNLAHVLYVSSPDGVRRWWTDAGGTRKRVLDTTTEGLSARVASVGDAISLPGRDRVIAPALARQLRDLGHLLLPDGVVAPGLRLLVTTDGALGRLPFGALDVQPEGPYRPVQDGVLLAYLRRSEPRRTAPTRGRALVVVGDAADPRLIRRRPDLGKLPGAAREGEAVAQAWPTSRVLSGPAATKDAVLADLGPVTRLHVASHVVQDAATPYLSYIPLAATSGRIEDAMLEPRDVLQADLGNCDLVVLSGCSGGVPFIAGTRQAPSFGDVFIDAGVTHAVQALWDVDDDATAHVMAVFARKTARRDDVWAYAASLREATDLLHRDEGTIPHPFDWAPWLITTSDRGF